MIWNYIRDFIVQNITGGVTHDGNTYFCSLGFNPADDSHFLTSDVYYKVGETYDNTTAYLSFGDWLATTLTTIIMCMIVAFAVWLVIWVFKMVAHAFLLRR